MHKTCNERILNGQVNGATLAVASRREQVAGNYLFLRDIASGMVRSELWQQAQMNSFAVTGAGVQLY